MKVLFESQELWDNIDQGFDEPVEIDELAQEQEDELRDLRKKDKRALYIIYQAVDEIIFERISSTITSKEAWDMLYRTYRGEDKVKVVRLQTLRCEFDSLKMKDAETVEEFYNRVILLLNQLRLNGEVLEDRRVIEKILRSLTRKFEYVVVAIEESKDLSTLSLESLLGTLQSHELRMRQFDSTPYEQAFQLQSSNNQEKGRFYGKEQQMEFRGRGRGKPTNPVQCFHCQKFGHIAKFCRKRIAEERDNNFINMEEEDDTIFMILGTQEIPVNNTWYVDSGCSNHMSGNKSIFVYIDETQKKEVRTGDDKKLTVQGIGDILVDTKKGQKKKISSVYYVPGLKHNLLSVGQLLQKGYDLHFKGETCEVKDQNGSLVGKINMTGNRMFSFNFKEDTLFSFNVSSRQHSMLWHHRFGHANLGYLSYMQRHNLVKGMPSISKIEDVCEGCMMGKQTREPFPQEGAWRATKPLELIHTDVCGPMKTPSIGGNRYMLTFIDDYSRKT